MARSVWRDALDGKDRLIRHLRNTENWFMLSDDPKEAATAADSISSLLRRSEPFYWTREMASEASHYANEVDVKSASLYRVMLPAQNGIHWFSTPANIALTEPNDEDATNRVIMELRVQAVAWDSYGRDDELADLFTGLDTGVMAGTTAVVFLSVSGVIVPYVLPNFLEGASLYSVLQSSIPENEEYRQMDLGGYSPEEVIRARYLMQTFVGRFMVASSKLLHERLQVEAPLLDRATLRQYRHEGQDPVVRVVNWRKTEYRYPEGHESQPVDWSCHWQVRKHTRTYKRDGRTIEIQPYIKGNLRAPYKPPAEVTVNVVIR